jgi:ferredoxin-NADP reductase
MKRNYAPAEILVCQAGACRRAGSEAVLLEIEELSKGLGCKVEPSGCVGACSQAPNAIVIHGNQEKVFTRLHDVDKSSAVVKQATGVAPVLSDPAVVQRLTDARQMRIRQQARDESKWNIGLFGFGDTVLNKSGNQRLQLQFEYAGLLESATCWEKALEEITKVSKAVPRNTEVSMRQAKLLGKLGRHTELDEMAEKVLHNGDCGGDFRAELQLRSAFATCKKNDDCFYNSDRRPENYAQWHLERVTKVSKHSAIYHFVSKDRKRGTPNPRGRGRTVWHKTWHTTLLAPVGTNTEGPLPWIERDYTPISTAKAWEEGKVDILIKIYETGLATSWLHKQQLGCSVWLSQPFKTLSVPSLVVDPEDAAFRPASYLLILAGSGIVAAPQVLHHTHRSTCFGGGPPPLVAPVSLMYACRQDDVCESRSLIDWCKQGKLKHCTLVLTEAQEVQTTPFPDVEGVDADIAEFSALENATVVRSRISFDHVEIELKSLQDPCRIVVSGPAGFNSAVKEMLCKNGIASEAVTILEA